MRSLLPLLFVAPALLGQTVQLADPAKPATLKATLLVGGLRVVGHPGREVVIEGLEGPSEKYPGMRRIDGGVDVLGNVVHLRPLTMKGGKRAVVVKLPFGSTVDAKCMTGGPLVIEDVRGPVQAEHLDGDITLRGAVGTVAANTLNGWITVDLAHIEGPVNLATLNGGLELALPSDTKADLKAHVNGRAQFRCDLPLKETGAAEAHARMPVVVRGSLNGGGTSVTLRCMNGKVVVRGR